MGGAHSRSKGRRGELEVLARLNAIGGDGVLNYGQEELSGATGDVHTNYGAWECKRRAAFPSWMTIADDVRGVYCRRDRGPWMVLLRADDAEMLMAGSRELAQLKYGPSDFSTADRGKAFPVEE